MTKQLMRALATLLAAIAVTAILAVPGGAAKPVDSVTCTTTTTFTSWQSGTTRIGYDWRLVDGTQAGYGDTTIGRNGPGSTQLATPPDSVSLIATFFKSRGVDVEHRVGCNP